MAEDREKLMGEKDYLWDSLGDSFTIIAQYRKREEKWNRRKRGAWTITKVAAVLTVLAGLGYGVAEGVKYIDNLRGEGRAHQEEVAKIRSFSDSLEAELNKSYFESGGKKDYAVKPSAEKNK